MIPANRHVLLIASVVVVLIVASLFLARRPYYNWDMFPYMALVMSEPDHPFDSIHTAVYQTARENMPLRDFEAISSRQPSLMNDPSAFKEVLPYYRVKPGYTMLARLLYSLGVNPLASTWIPSVLAYFGICLTLFWWAARSAPSTAAGLFVAIIATSPPMTALARYSSPDMLGSFILLLGVIMALRARLGIGMALFILTLTIRPDAIILILPVTISLWRAGLLSARVAAAWAVAGCSIVAMLFVGKGLIGQYIFADLSFFERMTAYRDGFGTVLQSYTLPFLGLATAILVFRRKFPVDLPSLLVWSSLLSMIARFFLHPYAEDRFNLPAYLIILLIGWMTLTARLYPPRKP